MSLIALMGECLCYSIGYECDVSYSVGGRIGSISYREGNDCFLLRWGGGMDMSLCGGNVNELWLVIVAIVMDDGYPQRMVADIKDNSNPCAYHTVVVWTKL